MEWDKITDIILLASLGILGVFASLGLYQWITRKSIKKVDRILLAMIVPLILMAITYVLFDKIWVLNTRPNGSGEPSFPSTHTMVVATIFFMAIIALPKYIKNKPLRTILDLVMIALIALVSVGRVAANMHWVSDVLGGLGFAFIFSILYLVIINHKKRSKNA